jgi:hypothetical protein
MSGKTYTIHFSFKKGTETFTLEMFPFPHVLRSALQDAIALFDEILGLLKGRSKS